MTFASSRPRGLGLLLAGALLCSAVAFVPASQAAAAEQVHCGVDVLLNYEKIPAPAGGLQMRQASAKKVGATINLNAGASLQANPDALASWQNAVAIWEALLGDNVTVNIDGDLAPLNPGVLGSTSSRVFIGDNYDELRNPVVADADADEAFIAGLPTAAQFSMTIPPGFTTLDQPTATKANLRALGFDLSFDDPFPDATITFSSNFPFDFDPSDGITPGEWDFEAIAVHELGHALGFISRVDTNDFLRAQGQANEVRPTTLDLFRFLPGQGAADFTNNPRMLNTGDLSPTQVSWLGTVDLGMSTGVNLGDGRQTSHWKADELSGQFLGNMDPTIASGDRQQLTLNDLRAFGAIGWDIVDCNGNAVGDAMDIANGTSQDCNANGIADECDIANGTEQDLNGNSIPDVCDGYSIVVENVEAETANASSTVSLFTVPDGSGKPFTEAFLWDQVPGNAPSVVDASITVSVLLDGTIPVPGVDIWLTSEAGGLVPCPGTGVLTTGASGMVEFSAPLTAGGFSGGERLRVNTSATLASFDYKSAGNTLGPDGFLLDILSADITGDGLVDLGDIGLFSQDLVVYDPRSDFFTDGLVNLSDVGAFSTAIEGNCPATKGGKLANQTGSAAGEIGLAFDPTGQTRALRAEPGRTYEAYLIVRGAAAREGLAAWEASVTTSANVRVVEWILPKNSVNLNTAPDFAVGTGGLVQSKDGVRVATLRFQVTDDQPASLALRGGSLASAGDGPAVAVGPEARVQAVHVAGDADGVVAWINDDAHLASDQRQVPTAGGVALRNVPNPFNPRTEIQFELSREGRAEVEIFDLAGRLVKRLGGTVMPAGSLAIGWDGTDARGRGVGSGQYFYRLRVDGKLAGTTARMSLLK